MREATGSFTMRGLTTDAAFMRQVNQLYLGVTAMDPVDLSLGLRASDDFIIPPGRYWIMDITMRKDVIGMGMAFGKPIFDNSHIEVSISLRWAGPS